MAKTKDGKKIVPQEEIVATETEIENAIAMLVSDYVALQKEGGEQIASAERINLTSFIAGIPPSFSYIG